MGLQQSIIIQSPLFQPIYSFDQNAKLPCTRSINNINKSVHGELKKALDERRDTLDRALTFIQNDQKKLIKDDDLVTYHASISNSLAEPLKSTAKRIKSLERAIFHHSQEISNLHASFYGNNHESSHRFGSDWRLQEAESALPPRAIHPKPNKVSEYQFVSTLQTALEECVKLKEIACSSLQKFDRIVANQSLESDGKAFVDCIINQESKHGQIKDEANKVYNVLLFELEDLKGKAFELSGQKTKQLLRLNSRIKENEEKITSANKLKQKIPEDLTNKLAADKYAIHQIETYFSALEKRLGSSAYELNAIISNLKDKYSCEEKKDLKIPLKEYMIVSPLEQQLFSHQYDVAQFKEIQKLSKFCFDSFSAFLSQKQKNEHAHKQSTAVQELRRLNTEHAKLKEEMLNRIDVLNDEILSKGKQIEELKPLLDQINGLVKQLDPKTPQEQGWVAWGASWFGLSSNNTSSPVPVKKEEALAKA